jgi:hypothetical protein
MFRVPDLLAAAVDNGTPVYPPTPAMKRFADSLARQKGIKPPSGYKTSISMCGAFLKQHAPKSGDMTDPQLWEATETALRKLCKRVGFICICAHCLALTVAT